MGLTRRAFLASSAAVVALAAAPALCVIVPPGLGAEAVHNGYLSRLKYYSYRMPNSTLMAMTA